MQSPGAVFTAAPGDDHALTHAGMIAARCRGSGSEIVVLLVALILLLAVAGILVLKLTFRIDVLVALVVWILLNAIVLVGHELSAVFDVFAGLGIIGVVGLDELVLGAV